METLSLPMNTVPQTTTRKQQLDVFFTIPISSCASTEWREEYYRITAMLRDLLEKESLPARQRWKQEVLIEALRTLYAISDPTESPPGSTKEDHARWAEVMIRRVVVETLDSSNSVCFYDCCEILKSGRSKAAAARMFQQARPIWKQITQSDVGTEFVLTA